MQRRAMFIGLALAAILGFVGCAEKEPDDTTTTATPTQTETSTDGTPSDSQTPDDDEMVIEVTIKDGNVDPNGDQIEVEVGEPITLEITSDQAGEIHVHSVPEIEIEFPAGETTESITIDRPGVVTVELHEPEKIIMELEAS